MTHHQHPPMPETGDDIGIFVQQGATFGGEFNLPAAGFAEKLDIKGNQSRQHILKERGAGNYFAPRF